MLRHTVPVLVLAACGADAPAVLPDAPPPTCNPVGDDCVTPFPSSYFEVAAPTATGVRVAIPDGILPMSTAGVVFRTDRLNRRDGFSPASPFLAYFAAGVDGAGLPGQGDLAASVTPASSVQILERPAGARVPVFAELDANASAGQRQVLLIRPMVRLKPATRYIVALVGLKDRSGAPLAPAPFAALRDRTALPPEVAPLATRYEDLFAELEAAGVARSSLTLAWDVTTGTEATDHLVAMRDTALAATDVSYRVVSATDTPSDPDRLRELQIAVSGPWFLDSNADDATMSFSADGQPARNGSHDFPVTVEIPRCAATATRSLPLVVIGHGLFGNARDTLADRRFLGVANTNCVVMIGTDWIGTSSADLAILAKYVVPDLNNIYIVTDRLQQAHVNAQVMTRLFTTTLRNDPALSVGGRPVSDGTEAYYFGASDGGIQGSTYMALQPDIVRGVLNVPGCEWTLMIWRSTHFNAFLPILGAIYPDPFDRQLLTAVTQSEWDYSDPATFAPHLLRDPLPGVPAKRILLQESVGDAQVPNLATEILARTIGVDGLELEQAVYGVAEEVGPLASAYTQWNIHPQPLPPAGDMPATDDNGAHSGIQFLAPLQSQLSQFFKPDGLVQATCGGPCDFPTGVTARPAGP
jgi:hypothetical protein